MIVSSYQIVDLRLHAVSVRKMRHGTLEEEGHVMCRALMSFPRLPQE